jgi:hypothetical protein
MQRLVVDIPASVADTRLAASRGGRTLRLGWTALHGDGDLLQSIRWTIAAMVGPDEV